MENNKLVPLPRDFYDQNTETVARNLLGQLLVRRQEKFDQIGKIIETEAYLGQHDLASHSRFGLTKRNAVMFGPAGRSYIYLIYGMYNCLNAVTQKEGIGSAVLIRALKPLKNVSGKTSGPGLLCKALDITTSLNNLDLTIPGPLFIARSSEKIDSRWIINTPRIGVNYAGEWAIKPLRYALIYS
jgi:DNA-3-methyladenine glycosylase